MNKILPVAFSALTACALSAAPVAADSDTQIQDFDGARAVLQCNTSRSNLNMVAGWTLSTFNKNQFFVFSNLRLNYSNGEVDTFIYPVFPNNTIGNEGSTTFLEAGVEEIVGFTGFATTTGDFRVFVPEFFATCVVGE